MSEAKQRAYTWIRGWKSGAAMLPIADGDGNDKDFVDGWNEGRKAKGEAREQAEKIYGCTFSVFTLAGNRH